MVSNSKTTKLVFLVIGIIIFLLILIPTIINEVQKDSSVIYLNNTNVDEYFSFTSRVSGLGWNDSTATVNYTISLKNTEYALQEKSSESIVITIKLWTDRTSQTDTSKVKMSTAQVTLYKSNNYSATGSVTMESRGTYYTIKLTNAKGQLGKIESSSITSGNFIRSGIK